MNGEERRSLIVSKLSEASEPINATQFAKAFSVTRQIIVADIALLRAMGHRIRAEHKGYVIEKPETGIQKRIVVKHGKESLKDELYAVVDNGGKVIDVIVEHSIYGMISASLNLSTRYDVDLFIKKIEETESTPLSMLTQGIHVHTI